MPDTKGVAGAGPKTKDSTREKEPADPSMVEGANRDLQDRRGTTFGDNTSSSSAANTPGQHGRDGGEINGTDNNPAPSDDVVKGERADDNEKEG
jgi:hypothetical protein